MSKRRYDTKAAVISAMLKQNTGSHLLDSGGHYGYAYERRRNVEFLKTPQVTIDRWGSIAISVFWYLYNADMHYAPKMQAIYNKWVYSDPEEVGIGAFVDHLRGRGWEVSGYSGEEPYAVNTYNGESALDGVILYTCLRIVSPTGGIDFEGVMVSTHNGCDVRGGYSGFRFFESWDYPFSNPAGFYVQCEGAAPQPVSHLFGDDTPVPVVECHEWETYNAGYTFDGPAGLKEAIEEQAAAAGKDLTPDELRCPICGGKLSIYW